MALNIITAKFCSGSTQTWTDEAYQWDYGQVLQFDGLELPEAYEVHFSNTPMTGETITQIGGADGVTVPDQFFTGGGTIYAWVYLHEGEDDGETVYMVTIPVKKRPQPSDDVPTPVEQSAIDQAIAALNIAVEKSEEAITHYPRIQDGTWHVWDVTEEEYVDTGVEAQGEQGQPGRDGTDGQDGRDGIDGQDGFSPIITVTDITGGHRVTITDAQGAHSFDVLDGQGGSVTVDDELSTTSENPVQNKVITGELNDVKADLSELEIITPEQFGAVGDGVTDDSQAVQDAVDAGYNIYFGSNKTYYLASPVTVDHDCHLFGGENTVIRTETQNGTLNNVFIVSGTLKKTTTLTTDYTSAGTSANSGNQFTLADMVGIEIGDILVITAEDQYYSYARQYYYLGATLLIGDMYNGHLYTTNSIPWDVALTGDVSVKIYDAPNVIIENLNFMADQDSVGHYKYMITLNECKNSIIRNCNLSEMDGGISLYNCVNTLIEGVSLAKSKSDNSIVGDGYGIVINSCSETIAQRIEAICAQSCFCLSGTIPNINTYLKNCNLASECRNNAVGLHENSYNLVVEDCTLTCLNLAGTVTVNRCRFIQNNRIASTNAMNIVGSHNPAWAEYKVNDCIFDGTKDIYITASSGQSQIQSFDNIVGLVEIKNCTGGLLIFDGSEQSYILSNTIKELKLINWDNCYEFYRTSTSDIIEKMTVVDCTFGKYQWLNDHNTSHGFLLTNIYEFDYRSTFPMQHKLSVDKYTYGCNYTLPQNVAINLSSNNSSAKYVVCGNNVRSDNPEDYAFGSVSGSDGGTLSRSISVGASVPTLSKDSDGNFVVTQQNNTNKYDIFPVCMFYIKENASIEMSAVLKNTGDTSGATFRPYIAIIDCTTGKLLSRYSGTAIQATAQGETIAYNHTAMADCMAMCYFYCNSPVASAQTTFDDYKIRISNVFAPYVEESIQPYEAKRITGDGTILSLEGVNNIMSSEMNFHVSFGADYVANPIGILPTGEGVSF